MFFGEDRLGDALAARADLLLPISQHQQNIKVKSNYQMINKDI